MAEPSFELYRLLVEEVRESKRARRELSNVFMTLNLAGVGALGFLARGAEGLDPTLFAWCAFALALVCVIWRTSNSYYTVLLAAKYRILYDIEAKLGLTALKAEYDAIQTKRSAMKWFTLERAMPLLFIVGYAVFFAVEAGGDHIDFFWTNVQAFFGGLLERVGAR
ncbi:MAG: hypothetical protein JNK94_01245 [Hyphomonadaceae bacterium]|nr:hypothetical protein [Hyphomonadaceae bacterium]MBX3510972.1 hypothetical protein [Hyphomonadaceae bacterium]